MNGVDHYNEAERLAAAAQRHNTENPSDMRIAEITTGIAQVHATLALAAATAGRLVYKMRGDSTSITDWGRVLGWDNAPPKPLCINARFLTDSAIQRCQLEPDHDGDHDYYVEPPF